MPFVGSERTPLVLFICTEAAKLTCKLVCDQRHGNSRGEQHVRSAEAPGAARGLRVTGGPCPGVEGGQGLLRGSVPGVKQAWATGSH